MGKYDEAKHLVVQLLETDLYNFRTLDLFCEIIGKQKNPNELFNFLKGKDIDYKMINTNTLLSMTEIFNYAGNKEEYRNLADKILTITLSGKIEENLIIKVVVQIKKTGKAEDVIQFINDAMIHHPNLASNSALLEKRATSGMDLAKKCIDTARDRRSPPKTKARAWNMCRHYLSDAEKDLNEALNYTDDPNEAFFIKENDIKFLEKMKEIAKKPGFHR